MRSGRGHGREGRRSGEVVILFCDMVLYVTRLCVCVCVCSCFRVVDVELVEET